MISRRGYTCDLAAGQGTSSNKIRTYPAGSVEPWNTRTGAKVGEGRRKRRREEKKEKERNTQIKQPFLFVSPFWGEKTKTIPMKNESSFCHISRILVFDFDQTARN